MSKRVPRWENFYKEGYHDRLKVSILGSTVEKCPYRSSRPKFCSEPECGGFQRGEWDPAWIDGGAGEGLQAVLDQGKEAK